MGLKPAGMNDCRSLTVKNGEGVLNPRDPVSANNAISEGKLLFINKKKNEVIGMSTDEFTLQELLMYALPVVAIASFPDDNSI